MLTSTSLPTVTGYRKFDLALFIALLCLMLLQAPRMRVYFQVTMVQISLARVTPDGKNVAIDTPIEFKQFSDGYVRGESLIARLKPAIYAYMPASKLADGVPAGTRFEWTVRWSDDSLQLNHSDRIDWEAR